MELYLEGEEIDESFIHDIIRKGTETLRCIPVLCGAALKNKGIQPLLDGIVRYLPSPLDVPPVQGKNPETGEIESREARNDEDFTALAFKVIIEEGRKIIYTRIYSGEIKAGDEVFNVNTGKKEKISRIFKIHANHKERVNEAKTGAIVGLLGLKDTTTGHTLTNKKQILLEPIEIYQPVISIAVEPKRNIDQDKLMVALKKISDEDPTFVLKTDEDAYQTVVSGMGELHLDVIARRIKDEFGIELHVGKPQVVYKETIETSVPIEYTFEKTINSIACKGSVSLDISPNERGRGIAIQNHLAEGHPSFSFVGAIEEGITEASNVGILKGFPITDVKIDIKDASFTSPEFARLTLKIASFEAFRKACNDAKPVLLVPIMSLTITVPNEFLGDIIGDLNSRKCHILNLTTKDRITIIHANAPLTKMFGYSTNIRSLSQGRASFSMYFSHYDKVENG